MSTTTVARCGIDVTSIEAWKLRLRRTRRLRDVAFTPRERSACADRPEDLACVWALKEAVLKAAGCGFGTVAWNELEVLRHRDASWSARATSAVAGQEPVCLHGGVRSVGDRAMALVLSPATLHWAVRAHSLPDRVPRSGRAEQHSHLARLAAREALAALSRHCRGLSEMHNCVWGYSPAGAPKLSGVAWPGAVGVSLTHDAGVAMAVVALGARRCEGPAIAPINVRILESPSVLEALT